MFCFVLNLKIINIFLSSHNLFFSKRARNYLSVRAEYIYIDIFAQPLIRREIRSIKTIHFVCHFIGWLKAIYIPVDEAVCIMKFIELLKAEVHPNQTLKLQTHFLEKKYLSDTKIY